MLRRPPNSGSVPTSASDPSKPTSTRSLSGIATTVEATASWGNQTCERRVPLSQSTVLAGTATTWRNRSKRPRSAGARPVIDLSGVRFISAAALSEFVRAARRAGYGNLTLAGANPDIRRVLTIVKIDHIFQIQ